MHDSTQITDRFAELAAPLAAARGLSLWGVELSPDEGRSVVRVYLEGEDGVTVDQCARVSRDLSVVLDVEDVVPGHYTLEVSSPGLDRRFFSPEQMTPYVGQRVAVSLHEPLDGRKNFKGVLTRVQPPGFELEFDGNTMTLTWDQVKRVKLRFEFPDGK